MDILQLLCSRHYCPETIPQLKSCSNWITHSYSYFTTGGLPQIDSSWRQVSWNPRPVLCFFQLNTCGHISYVISCLTWGWICRLQLLLDLAIAVVLRSESRAIHVHILLLFQIGDSPNLESQVPIFISPRNRVAQLYPHHWVLFWSSPATRMATMKVCLYTGTTY
jgi:hypothetical protein